MTEEYEELKFGDWEYLIVTGWDGSVSFQAGIGHDSGRMDLDGDDLRAVRDLINRALGEVKS